MPEYLVFSPEGGGEDLEPCIIEADSAEAAIARYHLYRVPNDEMLWQDVTDKVINASLLENFVLATDEEQDRYEQTGEYEWDHDIIRERIFAFFPSREWAHLYANYVLNPDAKVPDFPHEMMAYIRGRDDWTAVAAIPMSDIPRF